MSPTTRQGIFLPEDTLDDGRYTVIETKGEPGGQGDVYRCFDESEQRDVAVKVLRPGLCQDPEDLARIEDEIRFLEEIDHPNIVGVERHFWVPERGQLPATIAYVMPLAKGSLLDLVETRGCPDRMLVRVAMADVLHALAECRRHRRLHNDICEANILQFPDRFALADFGVSVALPADVSTATVDWWKAEYAAPERRETRDHKSEASRESDLWSWGVTYGHAMTGQFPRFHAEGKDYSPPPGLSRVDRRLVASCLRWERKKRPQSLTRLFKDLPVRAPVAPTTGVTIEEDGGSKPAPTVKRKKRRRKTPAALVVAALIAGVLVLWSGALGPGSSPPPSPGAGSSGQSAPPTTTPTTQPAPPPAPSAGYLVTTADGGVFGLGSAIFKGSVPQLGDQLDNIVGEATVDANGYRLVSSNGAVFDFGDAQYEGSLTGDGYQVSDIVGIANTADGAGYWILGADGTIWNYGSADAYSWAASISASAVSIVATPDGGGFWVTTADGGVFTFGDAQFYGAVPGLGLNAFDSGLPNSLNAPIVGMAATPDGGGYWLVGADGGVFAFGDAHSFGSMAGTPMNGFVTGIASTPDGGGYWLLGSDGGIFNFGDAPLEGNTRNDQSMPAISIAAAPKS